MCSAVQHERAPRTLIKRPSFLPRPPASYHAPFLPHLLPNYFSFPPLVKSSLPALFPAPGTNPPPSMDIRQSFPSPPRLILASTSGSK